jgi:hypothetical protein
MAGYRHLNALLGENKEFTLAWIRRVRAGSEAPASTDAARVMGLAFRYQIS